MPRAAQRTCLWQRRRYTPDSIHQYISHFNISSSKATHRHHRHLDCYAAARSQKFERCTVREGSKQCTKRLLSYMLTAAKSVLSQAAAAYNGGGLFAATPSVLPLVCLVPWLSCRKGVLRMFGQVFQSSSTSLIPEGLRRVCRHQSRTCKFPAPLWVYI